MQRYLLHKGFKKFGREGRDALNKYMDQIYRLTCFEPIAIKDLIPQEYRRSQEDIMILDQNSTTKKLKGRMVFNGKLTREWLSVDDNSSPTA